jgi:hypothetical protein
VVLNSSNTTASKLDIVSDDRENGESGNNNNGNNNDDSNSNSNSSETGTSTGAVASSKTAVRSTGTAANGKAKDSPTTDTTADKSDSGASISPAPTLLVDGVAYSEFVQYKVSSYVYAGGWLYICEVCHLAHYRFCRFAMRWEVSNCVW